MRICVLRAATATLASLLQAPVSLGYVVGRCVHSIIREATYVLGSRMGMFSFYSSALSWYLCVIMLPLNC
ncbi:hypothetical protein C8Q73DRAFT_681458 [Cubamyces lactineus]|nr:hypothetical protein C8Q73DRAFT_681458 [Cubamyces lactineus]